MAFPFSKLPMEVKVAIVGYLIPPMSSPIDHGAQVHPRAPYVAVGKLKRVSKDFKQVVESIHYVKAIAVADGRIKFTINPIQDTLVVFWMAIPKPIPGSSWILSMKAAGYAVDDEALPIRRLIVSNHYPMLPRSQDTMGYISRTNRAQTVANNLRWKNEPFETELPMFSRFPFLEEAVVSVSMMSRVWHISGFQMEGPDIEAPRPNGESWGFNRVGSYNATAARYFEDRGIRADTGIPWAFPPSIFAAHHAALISQPEDLHPSVNPHETYIHDSDLPFIGLYGYSRGTRSLGGKWAGFRYHARTHKVQFSPLAWYEVEPIVHRLGYDPEPGRRLPGGADPQFVARVWMIKEGDEPKDEPHHCWIDVKEPRDYDTDEPWEQDEPYVEEIATT
ncbi:hypothetical protein J7337_005047 [Fusarium musae]|uniref:Uncharacterized protein n=1 Tax=Fusarium musae TaxID=1042133 RepID=A0A9P8IQS0_9HYPO|nr:hypothetical protein J7337_005047 [Fusarium musae]KAG9502222.1 hypothetical protein J7337_005047 [Fusarium musae]